MNQPMPVPSTPPVAGSSADRRIWHAIVILCLFIACFVIARPFLSAVAWAAILSISAWPAYRRLRRIAGARPAVAVFVVAGFMLLVLPLVLAGYSIVRHAPSVLRGIDYVELHGVPGPPDGMLRVPLVGGRLHGIWQDLSAQGSAVLAQYRGEINATARWLLHRAGSIGLTLLQFALAIVISALFLLRAEAAMRFVRALASRIGGPSALALLPLAEHTIRAVSFGVVGTALLEAVLSAVGFGIAGQPAAILLGCATFLLCLLQAGPGLVFLPAAFWIWWQGSLGWALFVLVWHLACVVPVETLGRPFFISRGTGLPILLIFVGVLGGLMAFGFIGVFVGATVLAVSFTMLRQWLSEDGPQTGQ